MEAMESPIVYSSSFLCLLEAECSLRNGRGGRREMQLLCQTDMVILIEKLRAYNNYCVPGTGAVP